MQTDISVVIPAFNAAAYVARALDSVLMQTRRPREVIVVDDGSTDASAEVARAHAIREHIPLRVITTANAGVSAARNTGIRAAETEHVAFLDADDEFAPLHLQTAVAAIRARPYAVAYWSGIERVFDNDSVACRGEIGRLPDFNAISLKHVAATLAPGCYLLGDSLYDDLIRGNFIQPSSSVVKRETRGMLNLFNERARFAEDRLFFLELLGKGERVFTNVVTTMVHRDGANTSVTTDRSKALSINERVLLALDQARSIESIAADPQRQKVLSLCLEAALRERIYFASFAGLRETASAIGRAHTAHVLQLGRHPLFVAKNLARALMTSARF